jgi:hypothetical protein
MRFEITPDELQRLIQKRGFEIHKKENGTLYVFRTRRTADSEGNPVAC